MTLPERCQAGEAKLEQVSTALLDPRPEILEHCETELQEVIGLLQSEAVLQGVTDRATDRSGLLRLRHKSRMLSLQIQQAANLCHGWAQLRLTEGYTNQGKPALSPSEPRSSYEV